MNGKEFMEALMTDKGKRAQEIFKENNTEMTVFNCREWVIEKALNGEVDNELIELMNEANNEEIHIEDIEARRRKKRNNLDKFLKTIPDSKHRLFLLLGESGVGKSFALAKKFPKAVTYACNKGLDPYSLLFSIEEGPGGEMTSKETPFNKAMQNAEMVIMNEINELPHETLMFLQGITDETDSTVVGSNYVKIKKGFKIVGTMNPPSETDERSPLGDALMKRAIGYVLRISDNVMCERIGCSKDFLTATREFYSTITNNDNFVDLRRLTFRDFQSLWMYDFENQMEYLACMGDIQNVIAYNDIKETGEYEELLRQVEAIKNGNS